MLRDRAQQRIDERVQIRAFFSNYLQSSVRSRLSYIPFAMLLLSIFLSISDVWGRGSSLPSSTVFAAGLLSNSLLVVAGTASFMVGSAIANDYVQKATSVFVLSLPVRRRTIYLGRYLGALALGSAFLACYYLFAAGALLYYYGSLPSLLVESFLLAVLFLGSVIALGFMFSAILKVERLAMYATLLLLAFVMPLIQQQLVATRINPLPLLSYAGSTSIGILDPSQNSGSIAGMLGSAAGFAGNPDAIMGMLVMAAYLTASLAIGIFVYTRSEIK